MAIRYSSSCDVTIPFSDECAQINLQENVAQTYTVPGDKTNKYSALFGHANNVNLWVSLNGTAISPALGASTSTRRLEFIIPGEKRYVSGGDVLSLVTPDTNAYVGISLRSIPS
jgi:hypothetical protein